MVSISRSRSFPPERRLGHWARQSMRREKPPARLPTDLFGTKGFFLSSAVGDVSVMALFFFMMVFMDTTATIPTGAMAERWAWKNFCLFGLWVALPYCLYANWVWGGGWLAQGGINWGLGHGAVDFAGSGVVHAMGGVIALAGAMVIGPRIGKYDSQGRPKALTAHHVPMVIVGTFILAFGWFGFNPGSTLAGTDLRISYVVVNTMLAGIVGALSCYGCLDDEGAQTGPDDDVQRHACGLGRDHRALCLRRSLGRRRYRSGRRLAGSRERLLLGETRHRRSGGRDIGSRCQRRVGRCFPWEYSRPGSTARVGTASCATRWSSSMAPTAFAVCSTVTFLSLLCSVLMLARSSCSASSWLTCGSRSAM